MDQRANHLSGFLYASPSFVEGAARIFDFGDAMSAVDAYNTSSSGQAADARTIRADWQAVGEDIRESIERMRGEVAAVRKTWKTSDEGDGRSG